MEATSIWQFIADRLKAQQRVMLLVVVESKGSSPGRQGFKMAVGADGAMCGSIGGGIMEVKLTALAKAKLEEEVVFSAVKRQIHQKTAIRDQSGMICSGEQTVIFQTLTVQHLPAIRTAIRCLKKNQRVLLKMSKTATATHFDIEKTPVSAGITNRFDSPDDDTFLYEEYTGFSNLLYIVGGGHCALALSELMSKLDFYIYLLDDRPDLNTLKKNRFVHEKILVGNYDETAQHIPSGSNVYVVIMTIGYRTDAQVLRLLLGKTFRYLGLLGSAAKIGTLMGELRTELGDLPVFNQIHAPIGLKINSQTPEEIAISIAAEIIAKKNVYANNH